MHIILSGTGQVGSATARALLQAGQAVTIVTRDPQRAEALAKKGAHVAVADLRDRDALGDIFRSGQRAFVLNPPADPSTDTDKEERQNVAAILAALEGSGLEKIVAASTYGAFEGERCGDLTVLHELETQLLAQSIPTAINRGGYYFSDWAGMAGMVQESGLLPSFFPADLSIAMVAPHDLGLEAARRMMSDVSDIGIEHIEGPEHYTPNDVAAAFAEVLGREVEVQEIPQDQLENTFIQFGFSEHAAASYACMTRRLIDGKIEMVGKAIKGQTGLKSYIASALKG
ncbi:NmrA family NAD(P)-binding protein [Roseobacter sp. HKCCD9010]|uniref:NmrA family NAD(P)-binding protein n=1 Tax=unclassified Roseobacter TaxID=196798 RepID=UPI00149276C5|nr:NmrA family NAD(P)-binding protein [Rhodobacterales bacterium HKCCD4356]NNV10664.1 NmrA family NAD(P)-binding protein [Roseobacter sp. HKCCD7357]NNV14849.1 NmrA family NAD(P)-binding protein [Roseobacter sp. HKCCD8768]NNV24308.1 NmrA family NAD(P)-binding protein [Roseobacter sp. HKCCD8192]NNV28565.1 NmrA family NAD(P)-binding protein [Roseobacter sp. HKCCD9061]NNV32838.1 NmrA family NAD(P)-binding protein [Roseobacter sp. HKCCD9073]NNV37089.1 NmrA family NAD(P)-binding protein [Roseobacte